MFLALIAEMLRCSLCYSEAGCNEFSGVGRPEHRSLSLSLQYVLSSG